MLNEIHKSPVRSTYWYAINEIVKYNFSKNVIYNKKKYFTNIIKIGAAHNIKEINEKIKQGCKEIIFSRLFKTNYINKKSFHGVVKFNLLTRIFNKKIYPLGGINNQNLLKLNLINSQGFAVLSAVKKKPAITSRLF